MKTPPEVIALAEDELRRLEYDHYSDGKPTDCDGCIKAARIKRWLDQQNRGV